MIIIFLVENHNISYKVSSTSYKLAPLANSAFRWDLLRITVVKMKRRRNESPSGSLLKPDRYLSAPIEIARTHFTAVMSARMIGAQSVLSVSTRGGERGTEGPGALSANEMDVLDVRVSRDHSINAAASWQWLTHPGTQRDMTCASGRAPSTGRPIVTYLCTRQTLLIFLSFIAFVIVRSFTVLTIFLPSPLALSFPPLSALLPVSRIKCDVRRSPR